MCKPKKKTMFGFTIGERVNVPHDPDLAGWHGHIRNFDEELKLVDVVLDEPPKPVYAKQRKWFYPFTIANAPK